MSAPNATDIKRSAPDAALRSAGPTGDNDSTSRRLHWLGYAGLLPFVAGAALVWLVHDDVHAYAAMALSAYAALVLSFLGGLLWGLALREGAPASRSLEWGVLLPLVAWPALLMPPGSSLVILALMLMASYAIDRRIYPLHGAGRWLTLRFRLSAVAALSCLLAAAGS